MVEQWDALRIGSLLKAIRDGAIDGWIRTAGTLVARIGSLDGVALSVTFALVYAGSLVVLCYECGTVKMLRTTVSILDDRRASFAFVMAE